MTYRCEHFLGSFLAEYCSEVELIVKLFREGNGRKAKQIYRELSKKCSPGQLSHLQAFININRPNKRKFIEEMV